ncbi:MAG: alpha/beta fold hydrolase [Selenomonadaceae bacterium]
MICFYIHGWAMNQKIWPQALRTKESYFYNCSQYPDEHHLADVFNKVWKIHKKKITVVGWSLGGMLAMQLAELYPDKIERLLLIASTPRFTACKDYSGGISPGIVKNLLRKVSRNKNKAQKDFYELMFSENEKDTKKKFMLTLDLTFFNIEESILKKGLEYLLMKDLRRNLAQIAVPTEIIHGSKDSICLPEAAIYMKEHIPFAKLIYIENAGHIPFITREKYMVHLIHQQQEVQDD